MAVLGKSLDAVVPPGLELSDRARNQSSWAHSVTTVPLLELALNTFFVQGSEQLKDQGQDIENISTINT
jgi:hypothetical protein